MLIYLLTAVWLTPVAVVQYTLTHKQHTNRTTQNKQYTEQHKSIWKSAGRAPPLRVMSWHLPYN